MAIIGIVQYAPAILLYLVGPPLAIWLLGRAVDFHESRARAKRHAKAAIITRAEHQHDQIMSGDEIGGTFGDYLPAKLDGDSEASSQLHTSQPEATSRTRRAASLSKAVSDTGKLEVDFIDRTFHYTDSKGAERKASFPKGRDEYDIRNDPDLDDLARLLASVRGWATSGGQNEWWHLSFDEHTTNDGSFGVEMPNALTLELTGHNPRIDFESYIALRGEGTLSPFGRAKGQQEERLSHVCVQLRGLKYLHDTVMGGLRDAEEKGYLGNTDVMLMRIIYRKDGDNEFEIRMPCSYEKPAGWTPNWE